MIGTLEADKRRLGWLSAGVLALLLSSSAWALDLDQEIDRQDADSARIMNTLGRDKTPTKEQTSEKRDGMRVELLPAPKARRDG